ncbi:hypothetical protein AVEN_164269-1 [Araneus ventricosus]|uniref:Uncharacterized protein n=1 Tax=Araneus ventricosus TaxID=182803 RepID=A0A4Y2VMK9_ARAVE|nr:hypothetical protein AVEN_164269-1 [Araneus ventricosus]
MAVSAIDASGHRRHTHTNTQALPFISIDCRNRKNRCGSLACKCICSFQRCGSKYLTHQKKVEKQDGAITSIQSEIFAKPCAVRTARLFDRPQSTSTNLERLEVWPSHTPLEQGLTIKKGSPGMCTSYITLCSALVPVESLVITHFSKFVFRHIIEAVLCFTARKSCRRRQRQSNNLKSMGNCCIVH